MMDDALFVAFHAVFVLWACIVTHGVVLFTKSRLRSSRRRRRFLGSERSSAAVPAFGEIPDKTIRGSVEYEPLQGSIDFPHEKKSTQDILNSFPAGTQAVVLTPDGPKVAIIRAMPDGNHWPVRVPEIGHQATIVIRVES